MHHKSVLRVVCSTAVLSLLPAITAPVCAQQPTDEPPHISLVRQLGAATFVERKQAARRLTEAGLAAKPALLLGVKDKDLEVRLGAQRILVQVLQHDFDAQIAAFLNDTAADATHDLPGWQLFRQQVGSNQKARQLYADMLRCEADLLDALDRGDTSLEQSCFNRIQSLTSPAMSVNGHRESIPAATLATMLFVGCQLQKHLRTTSQEKVAYSPLTSRIYSVMTFPATRQTVLQEAHAQLLQQLLMSWVETISESPEQYGLSYAMQLVLKYDLREQGPRLAYKVLENPDTAANGVPYAAIVIGRFGTVEDAKYLVPHLEKNQVFHTWSNPQLKKEPIRIQVRDVVLAMLLRLHRQAPKSFGFNLLEAYPETVYRIWTFGFLEDSDRDEAFAKWKSWSEKDVAGRREVAPESSGSDIEATAETQPDTSGND